MSGRRVPISIHSVASLPDLTIDFKSSGTYAAESFNNSATRNPTDLPTTGPRRARAKTATRFPSSRGPPGLQRRNRPNGSERAHRTAPDLRLMKTLLLAWCFCSVAHARRGGGGVSPGGKGAEEQRCPTRWVRRPGRGEVRASRVFPRFVGMLSGCWDAFPMNSFREGIFFNYCSLFVLFAGSLRLRSFFANPSIDGIHSGLMTYGFGLVGRWLLD